MKITGKVHKRKKIIIKQFIIYCYIIKYCIFAFENIKYLHKIQEGYIKINAEKVHLNIQIIFKVLIFYYLLPFTFLDTNNIHYANILILIITNIGN